MFEEWHVSVQCEKYLTLLLIKLTFLIFRNYQWLPMKIKQWQRFPYVWYKVAFMYFNGLKKCFLLFRRHFGGGVCRSKAKLTGKTVIITGANTGIGKETAIDLAKRKAHVVMACRSVERGQKAAAEVRKASGSSSVEFRHLDLSSFSSVRQFAEEVLRDFPQIDVLINNAGIMRCPKWKTVDGFEMQFGVNHLGHFLLTNLLLERIKEAPAARIVNVASLAYKYVQGLNFDDLNSEEDYSPRIAYCRSKLANILFTQALAKRLVGTKVTTNSLHPGVIWTELGRHMEKEISIFHKASVNIFPCLHHSSDLLIPFCSCCFFQLCFCF